MKRTSASSQIGGPGDELREEYHFDYAKAKPNRFAGTADGPRVVVVLDPDVAEVFDDPGSVNDLLRALIKTMPGRRRTEPKPKRARTPA